MGEDITITIAISVILPCSPRGIVLESSLYRQAVHEGKQINHSRRRWERGRRGLAITQIGPALQHLLWERHDSSYTIPG